MTNPTSQSPQTNNQYSPLATEETPQPNNDCQQQVINILSNLTSLYFDNDGNKIIYDENGKKYDTTANYNTPVFDINCHDDHYPQNVANFRGNNNFIARIGKIRINRRGYLDQSEGEDIIESGIKSAYREQYNIDFDDIKGSVRDNTLKYQLKKAKLFPDNPTNIDKEVINQEHNNRELENLRLNILGQWESLTDALVNELELIPYIKRNLRTAIDQTLNSTLQEPEVASNIKQIESLLDEIGQNKNKPLLRKFIKHYLAYFILSPEYSMQEAADQKRDMSSTDFAKLSFQEETFSKIYGTSYNSLLVRPFTNDQHQKTTEEHRKAKSRPYFYFARAFSFVAKAALCFTLLSATALTVCAFVAHPIGAGGLLAAAIIFSAGIATYALCSLMHNFLETNAQLTRQGQPKYSLKYRTKTILNSFKQRERWAKTLNNIGKALLFVGTLAAIALTICVIFHHPIVAGGFLTAGAVFGAGCLGFIGFRIASNYWQRKANKQKRKNSRQYSHLHQANNTQNTSQNNQPNKRQDNKFIKNLEKKSGKLALFAAVMTGVTTLALGVSVATISTFGIGGIIAAGSVLATGILTTLSLFIVNRVCHHHVLSTITHSLEAETENNNIQNGHQYDSTPDSNSIDPTSSKPQDGNTNDDETNIDNDCPPTNGQNNYTFNNTYTMYNKSRYKNNSHQDYDSDRLYGITNKISYDPHHSDSLDDVPNNDNTEIAPQPGDSLLE